MTATATLGEIVAANAGDRDEAEKQRRDQRERNRARKQRQRERQREQAQIRAVAEAEQKEREAERKERLDEDLAPAVMRRPVVTSPRVKMVDGKLVVTEPGGAMLIGARVQIIDGRPVRAFGPMADPVNTLSLRPRERGAALALQADWRDVGAGLGVGAVDYLRTGGGGSGAKPAGHDAMLEQIAARVRLEAAMAHLGAYTPAVARVILDGVPVSHWAAEVGKTFDEGRAWIVLALQRLVGFYFPPKQPNAVPPILTFGPGRETYSTEVDALEVEA